jgi:hypothetical protein
MLAIHLRPDKQEFLAFRFEACGTRAATLVVMRRA